MGCLVSKPAEVDKEAIQRNQRIERGIKNDKKTLDRTIKILLLGEYCRWIHCPDSFFSLLTP
jgi:guanine nucleotide-binding protein subunit alpha